MTIAGGNYYKIENKINKKGGIKMIVVTDHQLKMQMIAREIYDWCQKNDVWSDIIMYFNGKAWTNLRDWNTVKGKKIDDELYEYEGKNPKAYFEYANPETFSMSFEGPLYVILNGYSGDWKMQEDFENIFNRYGYYYELGHAWNLAAYEL